MSKEIVDEIQFDDSGDGGSTTETYQSALTTDGSVEDNPDTVQVLEGFDRRRGYRKEPSFQILVPGAFTSLMPLMKDRNDVTVTITWKSGDTTVLNGLKAQVTPVTSTRPDFVSAWYDTDTTATDTPDTDSDSSWTELSEILGNFEENHSILTRENGRGLPFYIAGVVNYSVPMFYDSTALSNLRTEDDNENEIRLAIETQAGNYFIVGDQSGGGVEVEVFEMPAPDAEEVHHFVANVYQSGDFDDIITFPSGASNLFAGAQVDLFSFAQNEGDILTENR